MNCSKYVFPGRPVNKRTDQEIRAELDNMPLTRVQYEAMFQEQRAAQEVARSEAVRQWDEHTANVWTEFKIDAFEELGLTGHPKANRAFSIAWEHCHSSGLQEVFDFLEELAELLRD